MARKIKDLPRESQMSKAEKNKAIDERRERKISLVSGRERMWQFHYERLEQSRKQTRDAKKEIKELKKKVDLLHSTIGFLLTQ